MSYRCYCCLGTYLTKVCTSKRVCRMCDKDSHHSLLHRHCAIMKSSTPLNSRVASNHDTVVEESVVSCHLTIVNDNLVTLLSIVKVLIADSVGKYHLVRLISDSVSQTSVITSSRAWMLGLFDPFIMILTILVKVTFSISKFNLCAAP